jgi:hypothetical protein
MLKAVLDNLDGLADVIKAEYVATPDGKFVLQAEVENHPSVAGLKSALTNVRTEKAALKENLDKFANLDPEKYKIMLTTEQKVLEGKLIAENKLEEVVELRIKSLRENMATETANERKLRVDLEGQLNKLVIDNAVQAEAAKHGVKPTAVEDVLFRARTIFKNKDGIAVAHDKDGNPVYDKTGQGFLGISEWLQSLPTAAPHLFEPSNGTEIPKGKGPTGPLPQNTIRKGDSNAFLANLDKIAKGQVKVV